MYDFDNNLSNLVDFVTKTLKLSAVHNRTYSLSANQILMKHRAFAMHKYVKPNLWLYPDHESQVPSELRGKIDPFEIEMVPENFNVYLNPKITAITDIHEYGWELC